MKKTILLILISSLIILPFGNVLAYGTNYQYTGQERDVNSNLYYYGQRYYDPSIGRFTQPDPVSKYLTNPQKLKQATGKALQKFLENPQKLNSYSYTQNNPVRYTDPTGEEAWDTTTDVYFFNQSLQDYNQDQSLGNALALGADTIGLLPLLPAGTGQLFKGFFKGVKYFNDLRKGVRLLESVRFTADTVRSVIKSADNAYEVAKNGGKHYGNYNTYLNKTDQELVDSVASHMERVKDHADKLINPHLYIENFTNQSAQYVKGQIKQWEQHLLSNQEQANIKQGILNTRQQNN